MIKIVTVIGARPQFIKAATVSRAIEKKNAALPGGERISEIIIHTGQHYDENMSGIFFDELKIPKPDHNLGIGSESHGRQTGRMLAAIEDVLIQEKPDMVLTYGDTNSTLAGALSAVKLHIPTAHVEAGLRSFNHKMPEEINRIVTDQVSNVLFCPTETAVANLKAEGLPLCEGMPPSAFTLNSQLVFQVGDVMYDSVLFNTELAGSASAIMARLGLSRKSYFLATVHRAENTDDARNLRGILSAFGRMAASGSRIVLPVHPRTKKTIQTFQSASDHAVATAIEKIDFIDPVGYLDMMMLETNATAIFTDSGGVQKEAFFLKVPCITLREETEWVETVQAGWNCLTGADPEKILSAYADVANFTAKNAPFTQQSGTGETPACQPVYPYGNGKAAEKIVDIIYTLSGQTH